MNTAPARSRTLYRPRLAAWIAFFLALLALLPLAARTAQAAPVNADAVLLENPEQLWDDMFNPKAMEAAFGSNWELQKFPDVQADESAGGLYAPHVRFIWVEGSDGSTSEAKAFVTAHEAALKAFVARGGGLFINSATNEELFVEYDGRSTGRSGGETSDEAIALEPSHPIFNGPATPNATSFTGGSFAHGRVSGPGLKPLIEGTDSGELVLAEYASGAGRVMIGAMTAVEFQFPEDAAKSLRTNILSYLTSPPAGPPPPPATLPSNLISLGKPTLNKKKGTAKLPVTVPGPGTLVLTGKGVVKQKKAPKAAATLKMLVKSKGKKKKKLSATGKVKVKVKATFTPTGGTANSKSKKLVLKKTLP